MRKEVLIWIVLTVLMGSAANAIFLGTIEGYIYFLNGSLVGSGAGVNGTVISCSGSGCTGSTTSDIGSYYVIANLNADPNGTIRGDAAIGLHSGSATVDADEFRAAFTNITLCQPPSTPTLSPAIDNHDTNRTLSWLSGIDANGFPTFDVFKFDSNASITGATSPQSLNNLTIGQSYTWRVSTCNNFSGLGCCSDNSSDSFSIVNAAPSAPVLVDEDNTAFANVTFEWASGVDPDGDDTKDEFQLSNTSDFSNIIDSNSNTTSPITSLGLLNVTVFYWRVRTCDVIGACSAYSTDTFALFTCDTVTVVSSGGGGGGGGRTCPGAFNECFVGDTGCRGDGSARYVCGNFDIDQFLEFGTVECESGTTCQNGECQSLCNEEWMCSKWGDGDDDDDDDDGCIGGIESRVCIDLNGCDSDTLKPAEQRTCIPGEDEQPILLGVPPFTIPAAELLTTPIIPVATAVLAVLLAIMTLVLLFDKQIDAFFMFQQLSKHAGLIRKKKFAQADLYDSKVVEPHMKKYKFNEKKPRDRNMLRMHHEIHRETAKYHEKLALKVGEKAKAALFKKQALKHAKTAIKYGIGK